MHIKWGKDFMAAIPMKIGLIRFMGARRKSSQLSTGKEREGYDAAENASLRAQRGEEGEALDHDEVQGGSSSNKTLTLEHLQQVVDDGLDSKAELYDPVYMSAVHV